MPADFNANNALPALTTLRLGGNQLTSAPAAWGLGACKALKELSLASNSLAGTLPSGWAFASLQTLEVNGNQLQGKLGFGLLSCGVGWGVGWGWGL